MRRNGRSDDETDGWRGRLRFVNERDVPSVNISFLQIKRDRKLGKESVLLLRAHHKPLLAGQHQGFLVGKGFGGDLPYRAFVLEYKKIRHR